MQYQENVDLIMSGYTYFKVSLKKEQDSGGPVWRLCKETLEILNMSEEALANLVKGPKDQSAAELKSTLWTYFHSENVFLPLCAFSLQT